MSYTIHEEDDCVFRVEDQRGRNCGWRRTREEAEAHVREREWTDALPVGQRTSSLLIDARAVRSKALTTIRYVSKEDLSDEEAEIVADLRRVAELLDRWKRTGRPPKH